MSILPDKLLIEKDKENLMRHIDKNTFGPWAVVTGASSGIGKEFARQLAASGLNLVLVTRRLPLLEALGSQLAHEFGVHYRAVGVDLSEEGFLAPIEKATQDLDVGLARARQLWREANRPGARMVWPHDRASQPYVSC
jgi:NADP-dependent 3-hydroxy acid dehydrogenase YdfG